MPFSRRRIQFILWESIGQYGEVKISGTGFGSWKVSGHEPDATMTFFRRGGHSPSKSPLDSSPPPGLMTCRTSEKQDKNAKNLVITGGQTGEMSAGEIHCPGTCSPTEIPGLESFPARSDSHVS